MPAARDRPAGRAGPHLRRGAGGDRVARPVRHPPRARPGPGPAAGAGRPPARGPRRARGGHQRQGVGDRACRLRAAGRGLPRRRDAQAAPRDLPRADRGRRPADRGRDLRPPGRARAARRRPDRAPPGTADGVRAADRGDVPATSPSRRWTSRWSRSGSAAGSTRPTPGTAGSRCVTNVGLDHTDRLGPTVTAIAREKAAIIERGDVAATGATGDALAVIRRRAARAAGAARRSSSRRRSSTGPATCSGSTLPRLGPTEVSLRGRHQAANVAVADALLDGLEAAGHATRPGRRAAARVRDGALARPARAGRGRRARRATARGAARRRPQPGRRRGPRAGARRPAPVPGRRRRATAASARCSLWASMADKDVPVDRRGGRRQPGPRGRDDRVHRRSTCRARCRAADLAAAWRAAAARGTGASSSPTRAPRSTSRSRTGDGPVVVAGSLYLVGVARARLVDDPDLRDPVRMRA